MCSETKETGRNGVNLDLPQAKPPTITTITSTRLCFHGNDTIIHSTMWKWCHLWKYNFQFWHLWHFLNCSNCMLNLFIHWLMWEVKCSQILLYSQVEEVVFICIQLWDTLQSDPGFQSPLGDSPADHEGFLHVLFCPVRTAVGRHLGGSHWNDEPSTSSSCHALGGQTGGTRADCKLERNATLSWSWGLGSHPSCCLGRLQPQRLNIGE